MAGLEISNVKKTYGAVDVLHGVSIDIEDGEFVILVGPSGCGKSTLLRMIAGLDDISGGEVRIGRRVVNDVPPADRDIAMVFQNYALYPHMTVHQNMSYSLKLQKVSKSEISARVNNTASILGLEKYLERFPRQLSGGQRQRVAMGRAIVRNPQVFLFDEPLSNLDAKLRVAMRAEIKELHQRLKTTTVYVTHDQVEAMTMADKIVVMHDGMVEQIGAPLDLYDHPNNLFVASFIGSPSMNFIRGKVHGDTFVGASGLRMPLSKHAVRALKGRKAVYGIRPEHFRLVTRETTGCVALEIVVVEPMGAETQVVVRAPGTKPGSEDGANKDLVCVFRERVAARPGETIYVAPEVDKVHLFDAESGIRVDF
ncbi:MULTISPECIES: ABC transporter ATP-binding protein [unclassified Neorhizobium]|uniref:ABC transporter ATP-binding protein n=1 Tax=unclassified Neorhizobium TaxID=2629175 RepID=UPI001FF663FB|nr:MULTISPECIES: sn-glycerol-3-phosphate ABC transporter ATP-binding protein UgpC [unclassified Neorhizobium]MCJ9672216.1 sn-glycerol-3-phosphate ABC transporter ATP-binding protein UgpC [Neorhizobium sp. SHOUNA12B]MCJ9748045.1 sn-glycerol-3-phosphate ABC transporter ATP-binding protein UgpC [Neorhizobium sp. SHOUNA12A]